MLLRSSSTPVVQSFYSDSPHREFTTTNTKNPQTQYHCSAKELNSSMHHHLHLRSFSLDSSPIAHNSPSGFSEFNPKTHSFRLNSFRRAQSESNLERLASTSFNFDDFHRSLHEQSKSMLRTEPSFSIFNFEDGFGEESDNGCLPLERYVTIWDSMGSGEFSFGKKGMGLIEEDDNEKEQDDEDEETLYGFKDLGIEEIARPVSPPMYLATGFGMDGNGVGGGGFGVDFTPSCFDEGGDVEDYYKRMVSEDPSNPLFLRNYAKLLQSKGDLSGAEEFYFPATLTDPKDGEILLQYAKLVWELHHDQDRALNYFECAARAAPEDSHVLAAYASFLWEIDDKEEDFVACTDDIQIEDKILVDLQDSPYEERPVSPPLHLAAGIGIDVASFSGNIDNTEYTAAPPGEGVNVEDYYKRMAEENSCNPLFLRNYAQFLYQSKGDPKGAEKYYSRAILADPEDGEIISQYANLMWELYHDHDKALRYFERAVQASPGDSHILAAYARFLWETEEEDEHSRPQDDIQQQNFHVAVTPANAQLLKYNRCNGS